MFYEKTVIKKRNATEVNIEYIISMQKLNIQNGYVNFIIQFSMEGDYNILWFYGDSQDERDQDFNILAASYEKRGIKIEEQELILSKIPV